MELMDVGKWSSRWKWRERIAEWNRLLELNRSKKAFDDIREMNERHLGIALSLERRCLELFNALDPKKVNAHQVVRLLTLAIQLERTCLGVSGKLEPISEKVTPPIADIAYEAPPPMIEGLAGANVELLRALAAKWTEIMRLQLEEALEGQMQQDGQADGAQPS